MGGILGKIWDKVTDFEHAITFTPTAAEKREQAHLLNDQISAYKEQTEMTRQSLAEAKAEKEQEKRRIEEKQIRSLRNQSRSSSFMNPQPSGGSSNLGSAGGLPGRLGNT